MSDRAALTAQAALPRVRDVLELPDVAVGLPRVDAGARGLDARVRWVHVSELPDIAGLLSGGEMILTTGIALPETDEDLRAYADALATAGAVALVVELGRRYTELPRALVKACDGHRLPLVSLHRELRFVKVTQAVHSLIVEEQISALHASESAHRVFTRLCVEGRVGVLDRA